MPQDASVPQLLRWVRTVRRRLFAVRMVRRAAAGLFAGSGLALILLAAARFLPVADAPLVASALVVVGLAAGAALAVRPRIDDSTAARVMDRAGTDDAIVTALDMLHLDTAVARLQRADAEAEAARYAAGLAERLPWTRGRERRWYAAGLAAVWIAAAALLLAPNPMDDRLSAGAMLDGEIGRIERALDELEQSGGLTEQERKAVTEPLSRLREQALRMEPDALRAEWEAAGREIARLAAELKQQQQELRAWAQEWQRTPELGDLGRALERGDRRSAADALEQAESLFARLSPEQREALADRLRELSANGPDAVDDAMREALERAADALEGGDPESAVEALEKAMGEALTADDLRELAEQAGAALASAGSRLGLVDAPGSGGWNGIADAGSQDGEGKDGAAGGGQGQSGGSGQDGSDGGRTDGNGSGEASGAESAGGNGAGSTGGSGTGESGTGHAGGSDGNGAGGGDGSGSGIGPGSGGGSGSGGGRGSGVGTGTGSGTGGSGAGLGGGGRTLVTTPRIYAGEGEVTTDGGPTGGGTVTEGGRSPVIDGGVHSYEEVYASYEADARRALSGGSLPPALRDRVKNYFDEIQPDR